MRTVSPYARFNGRRVDLKVVRAEHQGPAQDSREIQHGYSESRAVVYLGHKIWAQKRGANGYPSRTCQDRIGMFFFTPLQVSVVEQ